MIAAGATESMIAATAVAQLVEYLEGCQPAIGKREEMQPTDAEPSGGALGLLHARSGKRSAGGDLREVAHPL